MAFEKEKERCCKEYVGPSCKGTKILQMFKKRAAGRGGPDIHSTSGMITRKNIYCFIVPNLSVRYLG